MMLFKEEHVEPIIMGLKTVTRRKWTKPRVNVGSIQKAKTKMFSKDYFALLKIKKVYPQHLHEMNKKDAQKEGGYTLSEFKEVWKKIYGEWKSIQLVYVVEFEVVSVTMHGIYGDGSECKICTKCGYCKDCGDCDMFGCGKTRKLGKKEKKEIEKVGLLKIGKKYYVSGWAKITYCFAGLDGGLRKHLKKEKNSANIRCIENLIKQEKKYGIKVVLPKNLDGIDDDYEWRYRRVSK